MTETARTSLPIAAGRDAIWHALTDPDTIARYMYGTRVTTDWQAGSPITYRGEWEGKPYGTRGPSSRSPPARAS